MQKGTPPAESYSPSSIPSFHGAGALNYRAPAEAAAQNVGGQVDFEAIAVPQGGCVVHAQDCWHSLEVRIARKPPSRI